MATNPVSRDATLGITIIVALALAILLPRIFDLAAFQTADEKMWVANTQGFTKNLALGKWDKLLQQPHPGITTQWLGALAIRSDSAATRKLPLGLGQSVIIGLIGYVFYRLWGKWPAALLALLLALNPFLVAHTRVYAMDSLLALFLLLSVGSLLLWRKTNTKRYLLFAAIAGALAVLSKLPGVIIIPFTLLALIWWSWHGHRKRQLTRNIVIWLIIFALTLVIVFPSLLLNFSEVTQLTKEFLLEGDAQDTHGPNNFTYYLKSLLFFSTPLHLVTLIALPFILIQARKKEHFVILLLFVILFVVQMSLGAKKGDRYILPSFLFLDTLVVIAATWLIAQRKTIARAALITLALGLSWQAYDIIRLHPHTLAYVNPITKPLFGERRLGWGEGLDLAAAYLNQKTNAVDLKIASQFPTEFAYKFVGETIPLNHYENGNADYVVLYRAMLQRDENAWETHVLNEFSGQPSEKVITLNGLNYVWIYKR